MPPTFSETLPLWPQPALSLLHFNANLELHLNCSTRQNKKTKISKKKKIQIYQANHMVAYTSNLSTWEVKVDRTSVSLRLAWATQ